MSFDSNSQTKRRTQHPKRNSKTSSRLRKVSNLHLLWKHPERGHEFCGAGSVGENSRETSRGAALSGGAEPRCSSNHRMVVLPK